jgi:IS605 OrfB family transposase
MGVDLGQVVLAYAVIIPPEIAEKKLISSEKDVIASAAFNPPVNLYRILKKLWKVKSNLLSEYRKAKEQEKLGMQSPIKNRIRKDLKALRRKEKNLMKKVSEHIANEVIRLALKNNVKLIRLENLQGIKKNELKFPKWNFGQLQEFISSRAELHGIKVQKIKPYQTSIRCPKCGFISKENRPKRDTFLCKECGFSPTREAGSDFVGALNIAFDINSTSTKKKSL